MKKAIKRILPELILVTVVTAGFIYFKSAGTVDNNVVAGEVKQIEATEVNIDCPVYEMGDKNIMGLWQKGDYFLVFDPKTNVVYYPSNCPFISENGNFCKYVDGKLIEISK